MDVKTISDRIDYFGDICSNRGRIGTSITDGDTEAMEARDAIISAFKPLMVPCTYSCEKCNKEFNGVLYQDEPFLCPSCIGELWQEHKKSAERKEKRMDVKRCDEDVWMRQVLALLHETELGEEEQKMVNMYYNMDMGVMEAVKRVRERREVVERRGGGV